MNKRKLNAIMQRMGNPNKIWHDIYSLVFLGSMQKLTSIVGHSSDRTRLPRYRNIIV